MVAVIGRGLGTRLARVPSIPLLMVAYGVAVFVVANAGFLLGRYSVTLPTSTPSSTGPPRYVFRTEVLKDQGPPPAPNEFYAGQYVPGFSYANGYYYYSGRWEKHPLSVGQMGRMILRYYQRQPLFNRYYSGYDSRMNLICHRVLLHSHNSSICGSMTIYLGGRVVESTVTEQGGR